MLAIIEFLTKQNGVGKSIGAGLALRIDTYLILQEYLIILSTSLDTLLGKVDLVIKDGSLQTLEMVFPLTGPLCAASTELQELAAFIMDEKRVLNALCSKLTVAQRKLLLTSIMYQFSRVMPVSQTLELIFEKLLPQPQDPQY